MMSFSQNNQAAQKIVGGPFTTYTGVLFFNPASYMSIKNKNLETIIIRTFQSSVAFGVGLSVYGLDYAANTFLVSGENPFKYYGFSQKASIGSTKSLFYYLLTEP